MQLLLKTGPATWSRAQRGNGLLVLIYDIYNDDNCQELYEKRSLLIMGRGYNYATCLEGALKANDDDDDDDDWTRLLAKLNQWWFESCPMIVITQVKELTYMHSEGIQVSVESKIPVKL